MKFKRFSLMRDFTDQIFTHGFSRGTKTGCQMAFKVKYSPNIVLSIVQIHFKYCFDCKFVIKMWLIEKKMIVIKDIGDKVQLQHTFYIYFGAFYTTLK